METQFSPETSPKNHGIIDVVSHAEQIGLTNREVQNTVQEIIVQTSAHNAKLNSLGERRLAVTIPDGKGGERILPAIASMGGQDTAGAMVFNGGYIDTVLTVADGCSFGDVQNTAKAAQLAVEKMLKVSRTIAGNADYANYSPEARRNSILSRLVLGTIDSHRQIRTEAPGGATTSTTAVISREEIQPGKFQYYLNVVSCGDSSVIVLSRDKNGNPQYKKLAAPADRLDKQWREGLKENPQYETQETLDKFEQQLRKNEELRRQYGEIENMPVNLVNTTREETIKAFAVAKNVSLAKAEEILTGSGIYAFLGGNIPVDKSTNDVEEKARALGIRYFRLNLSKSFFAQGNTDLRIMVGSDNATEKVPKETILELYAKSPGNRELVEELNSLMISRDQDDGSVAIAKVGALPNRK